MEGFSEFVLQSEEKREINLEKKATLTFKKPPKEKTGKKEDYSVAEKENLEEEENDEDTEDHLKLQKKDFKNMDKQLKNFGKFFIIVIIRKQRQFLD